MFSFSNWCLLCAEEKTAEISIKLIPELHQTIGKFSIINFTLDGFPSNICRKCHKFLIDYRTNTSRYENVERMFLELLKNRDQCVSASSIKAKYGITDEIAGNNIKYTILEIEEVPIEILSIEPEQIQSSPKIISPIRFENSIPVQAIETASTETITKKSAASPRIGKKLLIPPELFLCDLCPHRTTTKLSITRHMKQIHLSRSLAFECKTCLKTFARRNVLTAHQRVHLPDDEKPFKLCDICDLKLSSTTALQNHLRTHHHTKNKLFHCSICKKEFSTKGSLKQHEACHSSDLPHVCPICKKGFKVSSTLRNHLDTHGMMKYSCLECDLVLNSKRTLQYHQLTHSEVTKHECSKCKSNFKRTKTYKEHLMTHLPEFRPYNCDWCKKSFTNASNARKHKRTSHPTELAAAEKRETNKVVRLPSLSELEAKVLKC